MLLSGKQPLSMLLMSTVKIWSIVLKVVGPFYNDFCNVFTGNSTEV